MRRQEPRRLRRGLNVTGAGRRNITGGGTRAGQSARTQPQRALPHQVTAYPFCRVETGGGLNPGGMSSSGPHVHLRWRTQSEQLPRHANYTCHHVAGALASSRLAAYAAGAWVNETNLIMWHPPSAVVSAADAVSDCCIRGNRERLWIHVIGESTHRFFYAALLTHFNGTVRMPGFPLHWLPNEDRCSFLSHGWSSDSRDPCFQAWRGVCNGNRWKDGRPECVIDAESSDWRLTFEWYQYYNGVRDVNHSFHLPSLARTASAWPSLLVWGTGVGEVVRCGVAYETCVRQSMELASALFAAYANGTSGDEQQSGRSNSASRIVIMDTGGCLWQQQHYWGRVARYQSPVQERWLHGLNRELEELANRTSGALFLKRSTSMESAPKLPESPCYQYHPYGAQSEVHVQMLLNAVACGSGPINGEGCCPRG